MALFAKFKKCFDYRVFAGLVLFFKDGKFSTTDTSGEDVTVDLLSFLDMLLKYEESVGLGESVKVVNSFKGIYPSSDGADVPFSYLLKHNLLYSSDVTTLGEQYIWRTTSKVSSLIPHPFNEYVGTEWAARGQSLLDFVSFCDPIIAKKHTEMETSNTIILEHACDYLNSLLQEHAVEKALPTSTGFSGEFAGDYLTSWYDFAAGFQELFGFFCGAHPVLGNFLMAAAFIFCGIFYISTPIAAAQLVAQSITTPALAPFMFQSICYKLNAHAAVSAATVLASSVAANLVIAEELMAVAVPALAIDHALEEACYSDAPTLAYKELVARRGGAEDLVSCVTSFKARGDFRQWYLGFDIYPLIRDDFFNVLPELWVNPTFEAKSKYFFVRTETAGFKCMTKACSVGPIYSQITVTDIAAISAMLEKKEFTFPGGVPELSKIIPHGQQEVVSFGVPVEARWRGNFLTEIAAIPERAPLPKFVVKI